MYYRDCSAPNGYVIGNHHVLEMGITVIFSATLHSIVRGAMKQ